MKIATWNVNSIRTRQTQVLDWLQQHPVEVLCLQETKVVDDSFPRSPFAEAGYEMCISGQKSYNGVAILSRSSLENVTVGFTPILDAETVGIFDDQKRLIAATVDGIRIISVYVPNGGAYDSDKYHYKLQWLQLLRQYLESSIDKYPNLCICGDFNLVPDDRDIHKPARPQDFIVGTTTAEREALQEILPLDLVDAFREFTTEGGHYSWWDYRAASFRRNAGWRIDHHYITPSLRDRAVACIIDKQPRSQTKPSDHVPVILELK